MANSSSAHANSAKHTISKHPHPTKNTPGRHKWRPGASNTKITGLFAQVCAADDLTQRKASMVIWMALRTAG